MFNVNKAMVFMGLFMEYPAVIGTWMNGVDAWKWRNYSQDYTKIEYQNLYGIDYIIPNYDYLIEQKKGEEIQEKDYRIRKVHNCPRYGYPEACSMCIQDLRHSS